MCIYIYHMSIEGPDMPSRHALPWCVLGYRLLSSLAMLSSMLDDALGKGFARFGLGLRTIPVGRSTVP